VLPGKENERLVAGQDIRKYIAVVAQTWSLTYPRYQLDRTWWKRVGVVLQRIEEVVSATSACIQVESRMKNTFTVVSLVCVVFLENVLPGRDWRFERPSRSIIYLLFLIGNLSS
jgi:hypothetical protein